MQRLEAGRGGPETDPKFKALEADVRAKKKLLVAHPPAKAEAARAQGAARPPQDDKEAQGKAANAEKMNAAQPGRFDKAGFIKAVNDAIAAQAPKNLDEADSFAGSGKAGAIKEQVAGKVADGKKASAGQIESATKAPPDTAQAKEKPVTPLAPEKPPAQSPPPDPAKAVPDKAPPAATDFSAGPQQVNDQMAAAEVSEEQLAKSNEPEFGDALAAKKEGEAHAATAPAVVRAAEAQTLAGAKAEAGQAGAAAMGTMTADRRQANAALASGKGKTQSTDEVKRAQVTATLQKVFDATKKDVEDILTGLDKKVDDAFIVGEKAAREAFTAEHKRKMDAYKDERYSGLRGKGRWLRDKFAGLPEAANQIFVQARTGYTTRMQQVIGGVADLIGAELNRAKQRIAQGREQLKAEVTKLPKDLQALGKEAATEFSGRFDELTESVDSKGSELVQTLAGKYKEALGAVDEEISAEKEKNKGFVAKAVDAVGGVIKTILQLKDLLLGVLAKAAEAVTAILKDPIGFLGKLVSAVGAGLQAFLGNIDDHLRKGLVGWLTGAMAGAGLEVPEKFDLRGILKMIGSLLGLTWAAIRGRIVQRGIPEQAMGAVEAGVPIVAKLQSEGVAGIEAEVEEKVGDLKENLFDKISGFLVPSVLTAGITFIASMLNPASAFIRACKMIVDIVSFILERGAQIGEFVASVLDAVIAIARGGTGGVPALIEKALAKSVPVLIGALAAILGVGGIAEKVKTFFQSLSKPVMKVVDWVVGKAAGFGKKIWAKMKAGARKLKDKVTGKGRETAGPAPDDRGIRPALHDATALLQARDATPTSVRGGLGALRQHHGLRAAELVESGQGAFHVHVQKQDGDTPAVPLGTNDPKIPLSHAPNIGEITTHGEQGSSLRSGEKIHHLESEHILPFRIGTLLWEELGLPEVARGGALDENQTTIMLYRGAAKRKTYRSAAGLFRAHADFPLIRLLQKVVRKGLAAMKRRDSEQPASETPGRPKPAALRGVPENALPGSATEIVEQARIWQTLQVAKGHAVMRTKRAIGEEYADRSEGVELTHAERRGVPPGQALPLDGQVEQAAERQLQDIKTMTVAALARVLAERRRGG